MKNLLNLFFAFILSHALFAQPCDPAGDHTASGAASWIAHVYNHSGNGNPVTTPFPSTGYKGHFTESENFDRNWGLGKPVCATAADNFAVRFRMTKDFTCGMYVFKIGGDAGVRLSLDGGSTWILSGWTDHTYTQYVSQPVLLVGTTNLVLEYYEKSGDARVSFSFENRGLPQVPNVSATNPVICSAGTTQLIAKGLAPSEQVISFTSNSFSFLNVAHTASYNFSGTSSTVEAWINPSSHEGQMIIFNKENQYEAAVINGMLQWAYLLPTPGWNWISTNTVIPLNKWTHIAIVHNRTDGIINAFVNGILVLSTAVTANTNIATSSNPFRIGNRGYNSPFYGKIDNVRLWNIARTKGQIIADMYLETPPDPTNLIANYPLNGNGNALVGTNATLTDAGGSTWVNADYFTYTWSGGPNLPTASTNQSQSTSSIATEGAYSYTVVPSIPSIPPGSCTSTPSSAVSVSVFKPSTILTTITPTAPTACQGNQITFSASGGTTGSNEVIVWQEGECNIAYEQNWIRQPFTAANTTVNSANGILNVTSTSNDPSINMNGLGSFNPNTFKYINIRYKVTAGTASYTNIYWYNGLYSTANAAQYKRSSSTLISDNAWHIVSIDMSAPTAGTWLHSNVTGWRFDWATNNGVTMEIDFISLDQFPIIAEGSSYTTPPLAQTKTFYASKRTECGATGCISSTATLPTAGTVLSQNNESATCRVSENNFIHFYHSSGRLLASINSNGQNLGNVSITSYLEGNHVSVPACDDPTNPLYISATMKRHWVITPEFTPVNNISVRFPFDNAEFTTLQTIANSNQNPNDNLASLASVNMSKYSGPNNVNNTFNDNCTNYPVTPGNGGTTVHTQTGNGDVTSFNPAFSATGKFAEYSISPKTSEFWLHGGSGSPLPVTLTNFSASCDQNVTLNWSTASEQNSDKFILEKSRDGLEWIAFAEQAAAGNSNTNIDYQQVDNNTWNGITYYRLRQLDFNGEQEVFGPISTSCEGNASNSMVVYPNPNNGSFTVEITSKEVDQVAELLVTDITGKMIHTQIATIKTGVNQLKINKIDIQSGTYFVLLSGKHSKIKPVKVVVEF